MIQYRLYFGHKIIQQMDSIWCGKPNARNHPQVITILLVLCLPSQMLGWSLGFPHYMTPAALSARQRSRAPVRQCIEADGTGTWWFPKSKVCGWHLAVCQNPIPLVNIKIAGKWMFIPLKTVSIGIDPYPSEKCCRRPFWIPQSCVSKHRAFCACPQQTTWAKKMLTASPQKHVFPRKWFHQTSIIPFFQWTPHFETGWKWRKSTGGPIQYLGCNPYTL